MYQNMNLNILFNILKIKQLKLPKFRMASFISKATGIRKFSVGDDFNMTHFFGD